MTPLSGLSGHHIIVAPAGQLKKTHGLTLIQLKKFLINSLYHPFLGTLWVVIDPIPQTTIVPPYTSLASKLDTWTRWYIQQIIIMCTPEYIEASLVYKVWKKSLLNLDFTNQRSGLFVDQPFVGLTCIFLYLHFFMPFSTTMGKQFVSQSIDELIINHFSYII